MLLDTFTYSCKRKSQKLLQPLGAVVPVSAPHADAPALTSLQELASAVTSQEGLRGPASENSTAVITAHSPPLGDPGVSPGSDAAPPLGAERDCVCGSDPPISFLLIN